LSGDWVPGTGNFSVTSLFGFSFFELRFEAFNHVLLNFKRKLGQRLALKNKIEEELRGRIDQLEKRQTQDDAVINVINRSAMLHSNFCCCWCLGL
jgi:hypothetical protein